MNLSNYMPTNPSLSSADLFNQGFISGYLLPNQPSSAVLQVYRVIRGSIHSWMTRFDGVPVVSKKVKLSCPMSYTIWDTLTTVSNPDLNAVGVLHETHNNKDHHCNIEITNAPSGTYSALQSWWPLKRYHRKMG